jgi:hypothetical protein
MTELAAGLGLRRVTENIMMVTGHGNLKKSLALRRRIGVASDESAGWRTRRSLRCSHVLLLFI